MDSFDGRLFQGPFSKLLVVLGQIGWSVLTPPMAVIMKVLSTTCCPAPMLSFAGYLSMVGCSMSVCNTSEGFGPQLVGCGSLPFGFPCFCQVADSAVRAFHCQCAALQI